MAKKIKTAGATKKKDPQKTGKAEAKPASKAKKAPKATAKPTSKKTTKAQGEVTMEMIKQLREQTGIGMMACKKALRENGGNMEKAIEFLRKKGLKAAEKKSSRTASEGLVYSYIHSNDKLGVLLEIRCETDFVARTDDFQSLAKDICMQIAASNPIALCEEAIPKEMVEKEKDIYLAQMTKIPANKREQALKGKLKKFFKENCLLQQAFIKDPKQKQTVEDVIKESIAKLGENIQVKRFARFHLGEEG